MRYAVLNEDKVLIDYINSDAELKAEDGFIFVGDECDNEVNKYKWNEESKRFDPLPKEKGVHFDQHAANMVFKSIKAITESPLKDVVDFPADVIEWVKRGGKN